MSQRTSASGDGTDTVTSIDSVAPPGRAAEEPRGALEAGQLVDHFSIMRLIGSGGMGELYVARDTKLGRKVALKLVHAKYLGSEQAKRRFLDEARTTARFSHPHIVTIHAVGEHDGRPYVALEYLEGQNLRERMLERRPSLQATLRIALAIAEALAEAHAAGVYHLDLKPENVVIPSDGRVRVVDFGLARQSALPKESGEVDMIDQGVWGTPAYMAPEQWERRRCTGATDVWALGMMLFELCSNWLPYDLEASRSQMMAAVCSKKPVDKVDRYADVPREVSELISRCLDKNPKKRPAADEVAVALRELLLGGASRPADDEGPFRGLLPFTERHVDLFFGREAEIAAFVERTRQMPVLPVVGPSGAGKSSFVQAGVLPRLREEEPWVFIKMRPGSHPFDALAARLVHTEHATVKVMSGAATGPLSVPSSAPSSGRASYPSIPPSVPSLRGPLPSAPSSDPLLADMLFSNATSGPLSVPPPSGIAHADALRLADELSDNPRVLSLKLRELSRIHGAKVMLFVDQLEELFALVEDDGERAAFLQAISTCADDALDPVRVVFTVRDDYLGRLATGPEVTRALAHVTVIQALGAEALREALVRPLEAVGYAYEDASLPREMVAAVHGEPGSLPMLQFAAQQLWERRDRVKRLLLRSAYQDMGGVEGALAKHANGVLDGLGAEQLHIARSLLLRLVTAERTRKRLDINAALEGLGDSGEQVLARLTEARLVTVARRESKATALLELAHESLIHRWGTLARWLDESKEELAFLADAAQAAELWDKRGRHHQEAWRGRALAEAERMLARVAQSEISPLLADFMQAGREYQRGRQLRARVLMSLAFGVVVAVAVAAVAIAVYVSDKEQEARAQRDLAERQRAATLREGARAAMGAGAVLEARAKLRVALEVEDAPAARALWWQLSSQPLVWGHTLSERMFSVAFSPDGKTLAAGAHDEAIYLFDVQTRDVRIMHGNNDQVFYLAYSPDGRQLASSSYNGDVKLWDMQTETPRVVLKGHESRSWVVRFSPDGKLLASAGQDGSARLWDTRTGEQIGRLDHHTASVNDVSFSRDGTRLASGGDDEAVAIWDTASGRLLRVLSAPSPVRAVAFGSGDTLATAGDDRSVRLWNARSGSLERVLAGHTDGVTSLSFAADGATVVSAGREGTLRLWDVASGRSQRVLSAHDALVDDVVFSPDGKLVASASHDHSVKLWDTRRTPELEVGSGHMPGARGVDFSPDGQHIATGHYDGLVRLWRADGALERVIGTAGAALYDVSFSPDGRLVATSSDDWSVRLWEVASGRRYKIFSGHEGGVRGHDFSSTGDRIAAGSADGTVRVWHLESGATQIYRGHVEAVYDVKFTADDQRLVTGGVDTRVHVYNLFSGEIEQSIQGHHPITGLDVDASGRRVVTGGNNTVYLWDLDRQTLELVGEHAERVYWLSLHPDGRRVGVSSSDGVARIWNLDDKRSVALVGHLDEVNMVAFDARGRHAATVADDGTLRVFDADSGEPHWRAPALLRAPARMYSHRGWEMLARDALSASTREHGSAWRGEVERSWLTRQSADGAVLCIAGRDGSLQMWDLRSDDKRVHDNVPEVSDLLAMPFGCVSRAASTTALHLVDGGQRRVLAAGEVTAVGPDGLGLLLARPGEVLRVDARGETIGTTSINGTVTAVARVGKEIVVGFSDGNLDLVGGIHFRGVPSSPARHIVAGPMDTIIVGFDNGVVGMWNVQDGTPLAHARLHGRVVHLVLDDHWLHAASDLGDHISWDLDAFYTGYCELVREVWSRVPVVWREGAAAVAAPPEEHPCR